MTYEPLPDDVAAEMIGIGVHTGLRKGSEAPSSGLLWQTILDSNDSAWDDAATYCIHGLKHMGYVLCKVTNDDAS